MERFKDENFDTALLIILLVTSSIFILPFVPHFFDYSDNMLMLSAFLGFIAAPLLLSFTSFLICKLLKYNYKKLTFITVFLLVNLMSILGNKGYGLKFSPDFFSGSDYLGCVKEGVLRINDARLINELKSICRKQHPLKLRKLTPDEMHKIKATATPDNNHLRGSTSTSQIKGTQDIRINVLNNSGVSLKNFFILIKDSKSGEVRSFTAITDERDKYEDGETYTLWVMKPDIDMSKIEWTFDYIEGYVN